MPRRSVARRSRIQRIPGSIQGAATMRVVSDSLRPTADSVQRLLRALAEEAPDSDAAQEP